MAFPFTGRCQLLGVAMAWRRRRRQARPWPSKERGDRGPGPGPGPGGGPKADISEAFRPTGNRGAGAAAAYYYFNKKSPYCQPAFGLAYIRGRPKGLRKVGL